MLIFMLLQGLRIRRINFLVQGLIRVFFTKYLFIVFKKRKQKVAKKEEIYQLPAVDGQKKNLISSKLN